MRITLNLATRPFVELRPLYQRLRTWMVILALLALPLWYFQHAARRQAEEIKHRQAEADQAIAALHAREQKYQTMMQQPQNAAVLAQADFLNEIFQRKAFSWTAIMMDLETVMPPGVQVLNIDPVSSAKDVLTIRLRVSGPRDRTVELVRNLEHSRRFLLPRLVTESSETSNAGPGGGFQPVNAGSNVNFDIFADYNPLPANEKREPVKQPVDLTAAPETPPAHSAPHAVPVPLAPVRPGGPRPVPPKGGAR